MCVRALIEDALFDDESDIFDALGGGLDCGLLLGTGSPTGGGRCARGGR